MPTIKNYECVISHLAYASECAPISAWKSTKSVCQPASVRTRYRGRPIAYSAPASCPRSCIASEGRGKTGGEWTVYKQRTKRREKWKRRRRETTKRGERRRRERTGGEREGKGNLVPQLFIKVGAYRGLRQDRQDPLCHLPDDWQVT